MASSQARIEANRRNALKSTGPKTAEGKERSRANALKHGMAGDGTVIPADDLARVERIEADLAAEFDAGNELVASLIRRFAVTAVRLERCERHDAAMTARRVRAALVDRDNQRHAEVAAHGQRVATEPADAVRRLKQTPEGVDWLIDQWLEVRAEVVLAERDPSELAGRAGALLGLSPARARVSEWGDWSRSVASEAGWALARIDREVGALRALRDAVDDEAEAADRAEAGARALFDLGPEGERARRYEAAAERLLFRTLKELRQAQAESQQDEPKPAPAPAPAPVPPARMPEPAPLPARPAPAITAPILSAPAPIPARGSFVDIFAARPAAPAVAVRTNPTAATRRAR